MNGLIRDWIAIDTNVFEYLLNPKENTNGHISKLLSQLRKDEIRLLVDNKRRITKEYNKRLGSRSQMKSVGEGKAERILLMHWFSPENQEVVDIKQQDTLMTAIRGIIFTQRGKPVTDRFFVYVAFKKGRVLVTNDHADIVSRRAELLQKTRNVRPKGADIMKSIEAYNKL